MHIQVLHVENCPHLSITIETLKQALQELNIESEIEKIVIKDQKDAEKFRFLGSTSVRINNIDIDPIETKQFLLA